MYLFLFLFSLQAQAAPESLAIVGLENLKKHRIPILLKNEKAQVGIARLSESEEMLLLEENHKEGKCAGFEKLPYEKFQAKGLEKELQALEKRMERESKNQVLKTRSAKESIERALSELKEENLKEWILWFSAFPNRYNKGSEANRPIDALELKLKELTGKASFPVTVEKIAHTSTPQKSIKVHLEGKKYPSEIIVLGGHVDSIAGWGGSSSRAPGADDNASGSSNLIETLRVLLQQGQPERSVEFFWYAGEESGLLGSGEIARAYKQAQKDVVAVLQLDMTLFPGAGEFVIGNVTDYTSAWLRNFLVSINEMYVKAKLIEDRCGYACSDHASWYRQGYPTLMPFESDTDTMNRKIHTAQDLLNNESSLRHSLQFSKIALAYAMELANSREREMQ